MTGLNRIVIGTGLAPGAIVTGTVGFVTANSSGEAGNGRPLPSRPLVVVRLAMIKGQIPELLAVICRSVWQPRVPFGSDTVAGNAYVPVRFCGLSTSVGQPSIPFTDLTKPVGSG